MLNKNLLSGLIALLCLSFISQNVLAQDKNLAEIYFIKVKTGQDAEFEAAIKAHAEWRKQAGDPWDWFVHQVVNGENLGEYVIRSGGHTWADFDSYEEFGAKASVEFFKTVGPHMEKSRNIITRVDTTNINWYPTPSEVNLISVITYHLKPGQAQVFTTAVNKFHTAIVENNYKAYHAFEWLVNGWTGPRVSLVLPYKNWAEMQGPPESFNDFMARVLGPEEVKQIGQDFAGTYNSIESFVLRIRRDLSVIRGM